MFFLKINFHFQSIIPYLLHYTKSNSVGLPYDQKDKKIKNSVDILYAVVVSPFQS